MTANEEKLLLIAMEEAETDSLALTSRIEDYFDSLEYVDYLMVLREKLGPLPESIITSAETFGDLARAYAPAS